MAKTNETAIETKQGGAVDGRIAPILVQLYKKLAPLNATAHGDLQVVRGSYSFARTATAVHLTGSEFMSACVDYPIVFVMANGAPIPVALLGLRKETNLFVDGRGQWRRESYVPAYFRRYPFLFPESQDAEKLVVLIDEASPLVSKTAGAKLYENGKHGSALVSAIELGRQFHLDQIRTRTALRALQDQGLFVERELPVTVPGMRRIALKEFWSIDREKFGALSGEAFQALRAVGAIDLAYFHFASMGRLARLGQLLADRMRPPQRPPQSIPNQTRPSQAPPAKRPAGKLN